MASLPNEHLKEIWAVAMGDFSRTRTQTPLLKTELRALIDFLDVRLDAAESSILAALPDGDGRDWLLANPGIGRELMTRVMQKRREEL